VAEEASRLLDALGGWAGTAGAAYAASAAHDHAAHDHAAHDRDPHHPHPADGTDGTDGTDGDEGSDAAGGGRARGAEGSPLHGTSRCESCGAENGVGQAVACQLCPLCQGIALVRSVRPETVDRLADLAGAIAATLRDFADQRRAGAHATSARPGPGRPGGAGGTRVQDIRIDTDDDSGASGDEPGEAP
jgi:hypothetical protein